MIVVCREVDKISGWIAVYEIKAEVTNDLLSKLAIRARINQELRYFVIVRCKWEKYKDEIIKVLKKKNVNESTLERVGGIVEI